ncbi:MAG: DUF2244 domain-containing protein [Candidatus Nitrosoglobus sp.]|jgi:uncharacterized membrane protein
MISKRFEPHKNMFQFTLQPNNSLSWGEMKAVFLAVAAALGTISGGFSLLGLWLVFPFAGLELLTLGIAFYLCAYRAQRCEVITIDQDGIEVFRGRKTTGETWRFHRYWARIRIEISPHTWYMSHLMIGSHGREVEVGVFLTEDERLHLARELQKICGS